MSSKEAKNPDSGNDWQSIDIFVFSNGQQYSPPRKYHLRMADLNWWKSTLSSLARTQYGTSNSDIDLYTLEGKRVIGPLELSNGASYVAVRAPDHFIDSGYDQYLIRASRSWEKRQTKKTEDGTEPDESKVLTESDHEMARTDVRLGEPNKCQEPSIVLKTIISSVVDDDASVIVKPQPLSTNQAVLEPQRDTAIKQFEKKRPSIPRPTSMKKVTPIVPASNAKPLYNKRRESVKLANVKITRPEGDKNPSPAFNNYQVNKLSLKTKILKQSVKPKESSIRTDQILPKVVEQTIELKESSDRKLSTNSNELKNIIVDKEIFLASDSYRNPFKDMPSVLVNPNLIDQESAKKYAEVEIYEEKSTQKLEGNEENLHISSEIKTIARKSSNEVIKISNLPIPKISILSDKISEMQNTHKIEGRSFSDSNKEKKLSTPESNKNVQIYYSSPRRNSIKRETRSSEQYAITQIADGNTKINNEVEINIHEGNDNVKTQDLPPFDDKHSDNRRQSNINIKTQHNSEVKVTTLDNDESTKLSNSLRYSVVADKVPGDQYITHNINHNIADIDKENMNMMSNEVKINAPIGNENIKNHDSAPKLSATADMSLVDERYAAILNKGDVVNLNLNIEIQSRDCNLIKHNDNVIKLHSVTNIQHTEKGSQIDITNEIIMQNKSLMSMITKETNDYNIMGDNRHVIVVHCSSCKYCNDQNITIADKKENKNYVIVLPAGKVEESNGCNCDESHQNQQRRLSSIVNPVKANYSCMSLERISRPNQVECPAEATSQCNATQDCKPNNDYILIEKQTSEKDIISISKKKSVAINESLPITRESSRISHELIKTELVTVKRDYLGKPLKISVDNTTQTEWCDVLLEVRLHDDGRYTFRLPSLELLKHYKLG